VLQHPKVGSVRLIRGPDLVLDPFGGGGSTYAAAEEMHRHWLGVELGDCGPIIRRLRGEESMFVSPGLGDAAKGLSSTRGSEERLFS
jgi:site-specific DNA-methyltransferase (adenine-specific)